MVCVGHINKKQACSSPPNEGVHPSIFEAKLGERLFCFCMKYLFAKQVILSLFLMKVLSFTIKKKLKKKLFEVPSTFNTSPAFMTSTQYQARNWINRKVNRRV